MTTITISIKIPQLGERLHRVRSIKKLSQQEIARYTDISASRISEIEREEDGRNTTSLENILQIEGCLGVSLISSTEVIRACIDAYEKAVSEQQLATP